MKERSAGGLIFNTRIVMTFASLGDLLGVSQASLGPDYPNENVASGKPMVVLGCLFSFTTKSLGKCE